MTVKQTHLDTVCLTQHYARRSVYTSYAGSKDDDNNIEKR